MVKLKTWTPFEAVLLWLAISLTALGFWLGGDFGWLGWIGIVSSLSNVVCVILVAKKKMSNYVWGILGVITYAIVAYAYQNTGEWMLNAFYYLPLQFVGLVAWNRSIGQKALNTTGNVNTKKLSNKMRITIYGLSFALAFAYAWVISLPAVQMFMYGETFVRSYWAFLVDSASTTFSVVAMILMIKRYQEQWGLWIIVNMLTVIIWIITFNPIMLAQWLVFLVNSIYGYIKWRPTEAINV